MRLINLDDLLKELEEWEADLYDTTPERQLGVTDAIVIASQMPTVDAVPVRRGKWIQHTRTDLGWLMNDMIECSECGCYFSGEVMVRRSYCPNCGSDMRGTYVRTD